MPYDNTCKFLAETYPADFATWLLGAPVPLTILDPTEDVIRESVMVQSWLAEGEAKGETEGKIKATTRIAINLLREGLDPQVVARNTGLSLEQIQQPQAQLDDE